MINTFKEGDTVYLTSFYLNSIVETEITKVGHKYYTVAYKNMKFSKASLMQETKYAIKAKLYASMQDYENEQLAQRNIKYVKRMIKGEYGEIDNHTWHEIFKVLKNNGY